MVPGLSTTAGVPVPLRAVEISGEILAPHATVRVRQRYANVEQTPIEAIYTFPLPADAAVIGFAFECGGRRVVGEVREREEAFKQYDDALLQGHGAALLDQEREEIFTCSVGNLNPGEEATVEVAIVARTERAGEQLRLKLPTLVAPRFIPGAAQGHREGHGAAEPTARVPDADRISPRVGGKGEVDYEASLDLVIHAGDAEIASPSHAIAVTREEGRARVRFVAGGVSLDRDLILTIEAGDAPIAALATHREPGEPGGKGDAAGYVAITRVPELGLRKANARLSVVFLVDRSGSMGGDSIVEARRALRLCLRHLREGDRFSILAFDDHVEAFAPEPMPLTPKTLAQADRWIESVDARGGTELLQPLLDAVKLAGAGDGAGGDGIVVLLTDGQVGNEDEIAKAVLGKSARARIYSFGIGTNVSDALLRKLARGTGGAIESIHPGERIDEKVVATFGRAIARRVRDVKVETEGVELDELSPLPDGKLPDLVDGDPWTLFARYAKPGLGKLRLRGTLDGEAWLDEVSLDLPETSTAPAIAKLWARERVSDLESMALSGRRAESMKARIVALGVEHGLATRYTSFVAIERRSDERKTTEAAEARPVPVHAPAGWAMFQQPRAYAAMPMQMRTLAGAVAPGFGGGFPPPMAMPAPAPCAPPPMQARYSSPTGAPPPMPAMAPPSPPRGRASSGGGVFKKMAEKAKAIFSRDAEADERPMPAVADAMPAEPDFLAEGAAAAGPADSGDRGDQGDRVWRVIERQRVDGAWDGAPGGQGATDEERRARATCDAIAALLAEGITTAHPLYGEPMRKGIQALLTLLGGSSKLGDEALRTRAFGLAWLGTEGKRARKPIRAAIEAAAPALASRLDDEVALRAELGLPITR
jgi:Ca-activated chloride channel family protein